MKTSSYGEALNPRKRRDILLSATGIGVYGGALGLSFGAVAQTAGLTVWQTMVLSFVMFTGGTQFAFVVAVSSPVAAGAVAVLLALRNAFYGVPLTRIVRPTRATRPLTAHLVIDESAAMALAQSNRDSGRFAFYATGVSMFVFWQTGSLLGVLIGRGIDADAFGLDVAAPAAFIALLWPALHHRAAILVAVIAGALALALIPLLSSGVPVLATVMVAVCAGIMVKRPAPSSSPRSEGGSA